MSAFADTSLLCALYREQTNSQEADTLIEREHGALHVSSLVLLQFRQSTRLQTFRFSNDRLQGFSRTRAQRMFEMLQFNLEAGRLAVSPVLDWPAVHSIAEELSAQHTATGGYRTFDVLHVATAVHVKAARFLTFDTQQAALARKAGLVVKPAGRVRR